MTDTRLRAGDLSHRVTATAPAGVIAADPVVIETGVPMAINVLPLGFQTRENISVGGQQSATTYTLRCRYRTDMKTSFVLTEECCTQRSFQIVAIIPSDRRDGLDMTCIESVRAV